MPPLHDNSLIDLGNGVRLERGVRCRMSDGVDLVSDHYYPPDPGPHPTLLMRQPYGRDIASTVTYAHPAWFARHGFNVVIQDVRGRGDSGGDFYPFRHEARDGAETIAWLSMRPECNGGIGMYGFSYQGITQLLAAAEKPEGLICIAPGMTAHDLYNGWFYHHGALRLASSLGWGLQMLKADARRLKLRQASDRLEQAWSNLPAQTSALPFRDHPAIGSEGLPGYVLDWFDHAEPSGYWSSLDVSASLGRIRVPALHISGWYDTYLKGSIDAFLALAKFARSSSARDNQYLVAGPWQHIPWGDRVGTSDFGSGALLDTDAILLRWFNHWLKGSGEFAHEPRIRHFVLGENRWREADTFPLEANYALYLSSAGRANSRKGDGVLSASRPASDEPADIYVCDPEVPVPAPGGPAAPSGQFDQSTLELGNNLLVYTTAPLPAPLRVFGAPRVALYCATSAAHADFTAKLVRVRPTGAAEFVCIGIARSSWLFAKTGYAADKVHHWQFDLEPTSCLFAAGDRVRLEVASSAFPLYDRNPGNGVAPCRATSWDWQRSTQIVFHTPDRPSALYLPVAEEAG
ncbi:MAG TPA: CocE/NonD family hydrolase [Verrucomicrobiae bacterium]|nr:CocE/NonD family hydrolase [Verrucomicrobiae bacterium]